MRARPIPVLTLIFGSAIMTFGGCGPELESISHLAHIRIIGVRKSAPYARPGETVRLQMLWEDVSEQPPRPAQAFFAFWCVNPAGGLFSECLAQAPVVPPAFSVGTNSIEIVVPDDALLPSPGGPDAPDTGAVYVFYGVCAGTLEVAGYPIEPGLGVGGFGGLGGAGGLGVPAGALGGAEAVSDAVSELLGELAEQGQVGEAFLPRCVDESGEALGSDDFVVGYSTVFVFDELRNGQPSITGFEVGNSAVQVDCADESCKGPFDIPDLDDCVPGVACFEACELDGAEGCPEVELRPVIPESVAEKDEYAQIAFGDDLTESIWVSYFSDRGRVGADVRLVNDAVTGWNASYATVFLAPSEPGPVRIWAAVRDSRGGVSYVRIPGYVRP